MKLKHYTTKSKRSKVLESNFLYYDPTILDPSKLWSHQRHAQEVLSSEPRWIHQWEPRTGKTRGVHAQMVRWHNRGFKRTLVVAPLTVCGLVWSPDTRKCFPFLKGTTSLKTISLYSGTLAHRKEVLRAEIFLKSDKVPTCIIVNREALAALVDELAKWGPEIVILDELHDYKTPSSARHKAAFKLANVASIVRGLTGTIITRDYSDIYGQAKVVKPAVFGTSKDTFESRYIVREQKFQAIIAYRNLEELSNKLLGFSDIQLRKDCFDIPDDQVIIRKVQLPLKAKAMYKNLVKTHTLEHIVDANGKILSVGHALARLTMLQQLAGGSLKHPDGTIEWVHDALLNQCEAEVDEITEAGKKVVIFYRFDAEGKKIQERVGGFLLNGGVPADKRQGMVETWARMDSGVSVLIVQEAIGSVGLSFIATDYTIFYSCSTNFGIHTQAKDRTFKPQNEEKSIKLVRTYLQAEGTVHTWIMALIKRKQNASDALLGGNFELIAMGES